MCEYVPFNEIKMCKSTIFLLTTICHNIDQIHSSFPKLSITYSYTYITSHIDYTHLQTHTYLTVYLDHTVTTCCITPATTLYSDHLTVKLANGYIGFYRSQIHELVTCD